MPEVRGPGAVRAVLRPTGRNAAVVQSAVREVGDWLGFGVANLVNIFNPRDGHLRRHPARRLPRLGDPGPQPAHRDGARPPCREQLRLRTPQLGDDAALIGAAELAFAPLLADPLEAV